ncbi:MAG: hypothetical protein KJ023_00240 [Burkholderiaceae bacterium]|nr:hypothetical protein [Burkholderiaceae bacterium]
MIHHLPLPPTQRHARNGARYPNLYQRLLANAQEPEHDSGCWPWLGKRDRGHYPRVNVWVPGLQRRVTLQAHIALWVWLHAEPAGIDEFYLQYHTLTSSGLQLDHLCVTATCVCPDHIDLCTPQENMRRRDDRRHQRAYFYQEAA